MENGRLRSSRLPHTPTTSTHYTELHLQHTYIIFYRKFPYIRMLLSISSSATLLIQVYLLHAFYFDFHHPPPLAS